MSGASCPECVCLTLDCLPACGLLRRNGAHPREMADSRVLATARHIHICLRVAVLRDSSHFRGLRPAVGGEASRAWHPWALGKRHMRSSLASGKSATPPARCIHRPLRDTSSAEYRLLVSLASVGASRELSSRRSPALAPYTCAVSPTFLYGAFFFVASALAAFLSARLTAYGNNAQTCILQRFRGVCPRRLYNHMPFSAICLMPNLPLDHNSATMTNLGKHGKEVFD